MRNQIPLYHSIATGSFNDSISNSGLSSIFFLKWVYCESLFLHHFDNKDKFWFQHSSSEIITPPSNVLWLSHYLPKISLALLMEHYKASIFLFKSCYASVAITWYCHGCLTYWNVISKRVLYTRTTLPKFGCA